MKTVKFFWRAEEIIISKDSLSFFENYKDNFFQEILSHYKNVKTFTINLNFLFEEDKKDKLFEKLSQFKLGPNIKTFMVEDAMLKQRNLEALTKTDFLQNIIVLKLPRNSMGNNGIQFLFSLDRLKHIKKLDLSSNNVTEDGALFIASSQYFPALETLDLRINKIGDQGFKFLIQSKNYPSLADIRMDNNKIEEAGA